MSERYGASQEAWLHFSTRLGLTADILPVVSNPDAQISGLSKMAALGKTPSWYNQQRQVAGLAKWTDRVTTAGEVRRWMAEPDYGMCLQTRVVRAIDIDVPDTAKAEAIADAVAASIGGLCLPMRYRENTGKRLLAFRFEAPMAKRVVPVDGGIVEFLGDGQQFVVDATYIDSKRQVAEGRYLWSPQLPAEIPTLTADELEAVWQNLCLLFGTGEPRIAREKRKGAGALDLIVHDPVADWLNDNWETYDVGSDGQLFIECPFAGEHSTDSGPTSTAYFPAGTGGYQQGHFVCLHAHCAGRSDADYLDATGFNLAQFEDLGSTVVAADVDAGKEAAQGAGQADRSAAVARAAGLEPWPTLKRGRDGIEATADNLTKCLSRPDIVFRHLAYDRFKDELVWAPAEQKRESAQWRTFGDADMTHVRIELERRGFKPMGKEMLRDAIHMVAMRNEIDTAQEWLSRLRWDGVERVERFAVDCWGWEATPYSLAVGRYVWTALAGRVMEPGVRADMAPILVGPQGLKKTSAIQAMVPNEEFYAEIKLDERDSDASRRMRGKLIGELEELRGLNSRANEEIKAFVSRRRESWVPKFKEFETRFYRRLLLVGTTNEDELLGDATGERRWLPGNCRFIDLSRIIATRDQLWAEGAARFAMDGVDWQEAEALAPVEHSAFKVGDSWTRPVAAWLRDDSGIDSKLPLDKGYVTTGEALSAAIGIPIAHQNRGHEMRIGKALRVVGLVRRPRRIDGQREYVYVRESS